MKLVKKHIHYTEHKSSLYNFNYKHVLGQVYLTLSWITKYANHFHLLPSLHKMS